MGAGCKLILHFPADAVQARQHFCGQPHHPGGFSDVPAQARVKIHTMAHRDVAHMFYAANQAYAGIAGHDHAGRVVKRLHGRTAQSIDRVGGHGMRDFRQQRRVAGNIETLFKGLLNASPVNIINGACFKGWIT